MDVIHVANDSDGKQGRKVYLMITRENQGKCPLGAERYTVGESK